MHKMTGVPAEDAQLILNNVREIACDFASQRPDRTVSYTHLTLPTIYSV